MRSRRRPDAEPKRIEISGSGPSEQGRKTRRRDKRVLVAPAPLTVYLVEGVRRYLRERFNVFAPRRQGQSRTQRTTRRREGHEEPPDRAACRTLRACLHTGPELRQPVARVAAVRCRTRLDGR